MLLKYIFLVHIIDKGYFEEDHSLGNFLLTLYYALVIIRKALDGVEIIQYRPANPLDISLEKDKNFIPDRLYTFINWILSP